MRAILLAVGCFFAISQAAAGKKGGNDWVDEHCWRCVKCVAKHCKSSCDKTYTSRAEVPKQCRDKKTCPDDCFSTTQEESTA